MSLFRKTLTATTNIQDLYIVPSGYEAVLISISVTNNETTSKRTIFKIFDVHNVEKHSIQINSNANETRTYDSKTFLEQNDRLKVITSEGTTSIFISGSEDIRYEEQITDIKWNFNGKYNRDLEYGSFNIVRYNGHLYISKHMVPKYIEPDNEAYWSLFLEKGLPFIEPGSIMIYPSNNIPEGWLKCNGAEVSRVTFEDLYEAIGDIYGTGDGMTTFRIPDLRGEFVRGWDDSRGVDVNRALGSYQGYNIQSHRHDMAHIWSGGGGGSLAYTMQSSRSLITRYTGYNGITETRPRNISMIYCIKY